MNTDLAIRVVARLRANSQTLSVCESLSAGLLGATITGVAGASQVFRGGLITYATDTKQQLAHVPQHILEDFGPVSPHTARAMAQGARNVVGSDWAVALTGVAGPDEQDGHPVGEVWVGLATPEGQVSAYSAAQILGSASYLCGDRDAIRYLAVRAALRIFLESSSGTSAIARTLAE
ncbi:CinA family protein [Corynebacterium sp. ES2775-CONJ]|uniref:CinA family protein n=1 Tax=Corynebacterium sp. ES2775-CONJ TaxID=2974029 RepID=UPI002168AF7D|nr:nicotinamide-nucleotide amidohydrolase family protein [Corynebacterium sp. ES2775-CONJ]MCS4489148.1 nicotinamide-nucleotide amidohydrolase family protein [Corynebacterium sp. ES2775-CONJ]